MNSPFGIPELFCVPEQYRVTTGFICSDASYGNNGAFRVPGIPGNQTLSVIASDQLGWEHVSVSRPDRCPTWEEMCMVKGLFWSADACVMQLHPPKKDWVNNHNFCLHLWRPTGAAIPRPPSLMVGF